MSERNELTRIASSPSPVVPATAPAEAPSRPLTELLAAHLSTLPSAMPPEQEARERIAELEREARALGTDPQAALLFHEIGLLWEEPLKNPRNAAMAFQNAYRLAPKLLVNLRAARRLFADVGSWQMVLPLLDAELAATEPPGERAALLFEKGLLLEERLSREEEAAAAFRQCLELKPQDVPLLTHLETRYASRDDFASLVEVYRLLASALEQPALRAHYLTAAGLLLEERLQRPGEAAACFREAFALERTEPLLLEALKRVAEREGRHDELLAALAAEAEVLGPRAALAYLQMCKVYERLGRKDDALEALLAARRVSPHEPLVLSALANIYETQERFEELADVLLMWVGSINDKSEMVAINLRLAALYEEDLQRDADAIARYQAILGRIPGHAAALAGLGKLYHRTQDWEGLVSVFDAESAAAGDPREKAARLFKAAEVLEERLGRQEDAIQRYNACLQLQPGFLPAQKALTRLYERQGRYTELIAMYEQDLQQTADPDQLVTTLNKMAALHEERLDALDQAIACLRRILDVAEDHLPTLRNLSRLYERAGRYPELILNQEREASLVGDTKQIISLYHRNAEILDEHLEDRAGAIAAYERVLAQSPAYLPALKALGRLYAQDGKWEQLIRMYRAESELSSTPETAAVLIHRIGELYEHRLKNEHEAIASYQEVLTLAPSYFPALRALARIYRAQAAWESLVEVLRAEAANRTDPVERANALYQAAVIWEDSLQRPELAIEVYQEVLRLTPGHAATLRALERLYLARGAREELAAILERELQASETPAAQVTAHVKLARLSLDAFQDPARAAQCCEAVLELEPGHLFALKLLERIRSGDRVRRAELRGRLSLHVEDARLRTALRLCTATDLDKGDPEPLLVAYRRAFAEAPHDTRLAFKLERALRQAGDAAGLAELYARRLEVVKDESERLELLLRSADLAELRLNDLARAEQAYRAALELHPQCLPALQGLRRVLGKRGDAAATRAALEAEARACRDPQGALHALITAARLAAGRLQDPEGAIALYRQVLERDPFHAAAGEELEELLALSGGAEALADLHERRGEARLAQRDGAAAAESFLEAARLCTSALGDRLRAMELLGRALSSQPNHPDALELRGTLSLEAHQHAEAAVMLGQRVLQGGDATHLAKLHLILGTLYQEHLDNPGRATTHLEAALAALPRSLESLERLATLHHQARRWTDAASCLQRLLVLELPPEERARHTLALARLQDEALGDTTAAAELYRQALELDPRDPTPVDRLVVLYERAGNLPELAQMLEAQAAQAAAQADPKRAATLRLRAAELYAGPLGEPSRAVALGRQVVEAEPAFAPARVLLADLYLRDPASAQLAIEEHRHLLRLEPTRVESLHALFRLWEGVKQPDKAFCAAAALSFLRSANDVEVAFHAEARLRLGQEAQGRLGLADVDAGLMHPEGRGPLLEVMRAIGDQMGKLYPPQLELLGVDRKTDRLKPDHAVFKAVRTVAQVFGVEEFDVYQARRGLVGLETTEPLSVCVSQDMVRRFNIREQKFLFGRAALGLLNKTAVLSKLSRGETADLLGGSVRIFVPQFTALGRTHEETTRQFRRAYSRKALKELEPAALALAGTTQVDLDTVVNAFSYSADRAGLLMCADVSVGLNLVLREDPGFASGRVEGPEPVLHALRERADLQELLSYALSEDFFRLRQRLGLAL